MDDTKDRPVLMGLVALAAVALVVGLLGGAAMLVGVKALGLDGESAAGSSDAGSGGTLYLPKPTDTPSATTPVETVEPVVPDASESPAEPVAAITLSAAQVSVAPMQQIDLTGTYPTGEGAILQVQRFENGAWSDFPVTASVSGQTFGTYVQTSQAGPNRFRVIDTDTQTTSNEVTVTVG